MLKSTVLPLISLDFEVNSEFFCSAKMLICLLVVVTILFGARAQSCNRTYAAAYTNNVPGALSVVTDNDPSFVYDSSQCTSTEQKFINPNWFVGSCGKAYVSACGGVGQGTGNGDWNWGWYILDSGETCQAGIYQPLGVSYSRTCCIANFAAMEEHLYTLNRESLTPDPHFPSRVSINIASSAGFPHSIGGGYTKTDGQAVAANYSSFVLQGSVYGFCRV